jgi:hypothetical protein
LCTLQPGNGTSQTNIFIGRKRHVLSDENNFFSVRSQFWSTNRPEFSTKKISYMERLSADILWLVLQHLPCDDIARNKAVCLAWRAVVDDIPDECWKTMFCARVCADLCVGVGFDWRLAAVRAACAARQESVEASCTWHSGVKVCLDAPWKACRTIDAPLSAGVVRRVDPQNTNVVDYVYDNMFRMRAIGRSCLQQPGVTTECSNCVNKRQCLFMRYGYYLRPLDESSLTDLDECLSQRLCDANR